MSPQENPLESPLLPNDFQQDQPRQDAILPAPGRDRSLVDACNAFRRVLLPDGEGDGPEVYLDRSRQIQIVETEAKRLGILYDGLEPVQEGGREHDLAYDFRTSTVLKFTKPSRAAYVVDFLSGRPHLVNGDPLEYLDRLILQNEIFGKFTTFVGIGGLPNHRRIITRQKLVRGRGADWDEIARFMAEDLGFVKMRWNQDIGYESSYAFLRDDVAVFDLRPANVIVTDCGLPISIDSIPVRLNPQTRKFLED